MDKLAIMIARIFPTSSVEYLFAIFGMIVNSYFSAVISSQSVSPEANKCNASIVIRRAKPKDLHSLADVLTTSFHPPEGLLWWMFPLLKLGVYEDLRSRLQSNSPHYTCLVASQTRMAGIGGDEEVIGTVEITVRSQSSWIPTEPPAPYISNLAVSHAHRRQGIARKLLLKCEQIALEWGFKELSLHVLENNYQA